jgi:lipid-binding SYLF domain-containing protein
MKKIAGAFSLSALLVLCAGFARADQFSDTVSLFENAGASGHFFKNCYGYAVFPVVGEGGFIVGGAFGKGQVYEQGRLVGDTTMTQLSVGFQAGGKGYSQIIFFQDKRSLDEFQSGRFEFSAGASAVAVTAAASASAGTGGISSGVSGGQRDATTSGIYNSGMAVFTIAKGGLMYAAAIAGQRFTYQARGPG